MFSRSGLLNGLHHGLELSLPMISEKHHHKVVTWIVTEFL